MVTRIAGGKVLLSDGQFADASLLFESGLILGTEHGGDSTIDADGCYVLPGIIDIHGDAFERLMMPRHDAFMPFPVALAEADRQLVANGITTAFFSMSYSWEKHAPLRGDSGAPAVMDAFHTARPHLLCDPHLHLRFEIYHLEGLPLVREWLDTGKIDLLAFNDHLSYYQSKLDDPEALAAFAARLKATPSEVGALLATVGRRKEQALGEVRGLAELARLSGVAMASHDEEEPRARQWYHEIGCRICEFPCNAETAREALRLGDHVVLGAPNALKGGSLYDRISVRQAVADRLCTVLASDYYYPALLQAAFLLDDLGTSSLAEAWRLVSANVADSVGLADRGLLEPGKRADIVIVRPRDGQRPPSVEATLVAGELVHASSCLLARNRPLVPAAKPRPAATTE